MEAAQSNCVRCQIQTIHSFTPSLTRKPISASPSSGGLLPYSCFMRFPSSRKRRSKSLVSRAFNMASVVEGVDGWVPRSWPGSLATPSSSPPDFGGAIPYHSEDVVKEPCAVKKTASSCQAVGSANR